MSAQSATLPPAARQSKPSGRSGPDSQGRRSWYVNSLAQSIACSIVDTLAGQETVQGGHFLFGHQVKEHDGPPATFPPGPGLAGGAGGPTRRDVRPSTRRALERQRNKERLHGAAPNNIPGPQRGGNS